MNDEGLALLRELLDICELQASLLRNTLGQRGGWSKDPETLGNRVRAYLAACEANELEEEVRTGK